MAERKKRSLLLRINIAAAISLFGGSLALATWGGIVLNQNKIESEYLKKNFATILKDRYQKGPSQSSREMVWPDEIYQSHPKATHISRIQIDQAFPYLKYVSFSIKDHSGWHTYNFQIEHYRKLSSLTNQKLSETDSRVADFEKVKVGLLN